MKGEETYLLARRGTPAGRDGTAGRSMNQFGRGAIRPSIAVLRIVRHRTGRRLRRRPIVQGERQKTGIGGGGLIIHLLRIR